MALEMRDESVHGSVLPLSLKASARFLAQVSCQHSDLGHVGRRLPPQHACLTAAGRAHVTQDREG